MKYGIFLSTGINKIDKSQKPSNELIKKKGWLLVGQVKLLNGVLSELPDL